LRGCISFYIQANRGEGIGNRSHCLELRAHAEIFWFGQSGRSVVAGGKTELLRSELLLWCHGIHIGYRPSCKAPGESDSRRFKSRSMSRSKL